MKNNAINENKDVSSVENECDGKLEKKKSGASASKGKRIEKDYMNEEVSIRLFKDNNRYKDDLFVAVNGESCLIKRGVEVKVKRKFAEVIEGMLKQDEIAGELMESISREFTEFTSSNGIG